MSKEPSKPKCIYCGSENLRNIIGLKQTYCNDCSAINPSEDIVELDKNKKESD